MTWTTIDLDLFRLNIILHNDYDQRTVQWEALKSFLLNFFGLGADTDFHTMVSFSFQKESMFACRGPYKYTPPFADGNETLLIRSPVEIAILRHEVPLFTEALDAMRYCPVENDKPYLVYNKNYTRSKPPFSAIVTAMVNANLSYICLVKKGMRWAITNEDHDPFRTLFDHIDQLRNDHHITVHIPMLDMAVMTNTVKRTCSDWGYHPHLRIHGPFTMGWNRQWRPIWSLSRNRRGNFQIIQDHHTNQVFQLLDPQVNYTDTPIGVSEIKLYHTIAHTVRNYLSNPIHPNTNLNKQLLQNTLKKTKNLLSLLNDVLHVSIDRMCTPDKIGGSLRKEICFRFPYQKNGNDYHPEFINTVSYHLMNERTLDAFLNSFEYTSSNLLADIGMRPHLYDTHLSYNEVIHRASTSLAVLLRETHGRNELKFQQKFNSIEKQQFFTAHFAEVCVLLGYTGSHMFSAFNNWTYRGDEEPSPYDPDGRLLLRREPGDQAQFFDTSGNVLDTGYARICQRLNITNIENLQPNTAVGKAYTDKMRNNIQTNLHQLQMSRNQHETVGSRKKFLTVKPYLIEFGVIPNDPEVPDNSLGAGALPNTGVPTIPAAVAGDAFLAHSILDPEVTAQVGTQEEIDERNANLMFLQGGDIHSFWCFMLEKMKLLHNPDFADPNHQNHDSYIPIYPQAWIIINQIVPFYRDRRKGDVLKKLARWLRVKVFDSKRTLSDISLQIAYIYRVSDTHPFDIPENWVPHPQQVQIPLHVFITPP